MCFRFSIVLIFNNFTIDIYIHTSSNKSMHSHTNLIDYKCQDLLVWFG